MKKLKSFELYTKDMDIDWVDDILPPPPIEKEYGDSGGNGKFYYNYQFNFFLDTNSESGIQALLDDVMDDEFNILSIDGMRVVFQTEDMNGMMSDDVYWIDGYIDAKDGMSEAQVKNIISALIYTRGNSAFRLRDEEFEDLGYREELKKA